MRSNRSSRRLSTGSPHTLTAHVRRGVIRSLYNRARKVTTNAEKLKEEEKHLSDGFVSNGYPLPFIKAASAPTACEGGDREGDEGEKEEEPMVVTPYMAGLSVKT